MGNKNCFELTGGSSYRDVDCIKATEGTCEQEIICGFFGLF